MERYGFFGGSFNPVTNAHIDIARKILKTYKLDKIIFIPMGNSYEKSGLIDENDRYNMLDIVVKKYKQLEVSNIELNKEKLTTLEAFKLIEKKYQHIEKYFILGGDNLYKIISSKDSKELINNYKYIIIQRGKEDLKTSLNTNEILTKKKENFYIMENETYKNVSSSNIRKKIANNETTKLNIDKDVLEYINKKNLYSCT